MNIILTNRGPVQSQVSIGQVKTSDRVVYEVIRIMDQIPLFLADHFDRLVKSMSFQNWKPDMDFEEFRYKTTQLIQLNQKSIGNIRFEIGRSGDEDFWTYQFIEHSFPSAENYRNGVSTDLVFDERPNPNAKVVQTEIREKCNQMIREHKLFEVLLVDRNSWITEGSRTNVFFVKDEVFYTAPDTMVLVGITRQKVMNCLQQLGYKIVEEPVSVSRIGEFDAVFLTGTSPKVLPVSSIGKQIYSTSNVGVNKLISSYNNLIDSYIKNEISNRI